MLRRVEVGLRPHVEDVVGRKVAKGIRRALGIEVTRAGLIKAYTLAGLDQDALAEILDAAALHDPVLHQASLTPLARDFDWIIEVGFRPGVTDNEGRTARESLAMALGLPPEDAGDLAVYTSTQYLLTGPLDQGDVTRIARDYLANELIQRFEYKSKDQWNEAPGFELKPAGVTGLATDEVCAVGLEAMSDKELLDFSRENTLALSLEEMKTLSAYFSRKDVRAARAAKGFPSDPTDAEIEVLAQTWSEHCKHKIFNARIAYENKELAQKSVITSLFDTYIQGSTETLKKRMGKDDFCLSVFKDNAGVIRLNEDFSLCVKVETHNSPSALDPYGGALTGIVGVNRDPMGTGLGANLICNTDVFCFASPFFKGEILSRLLHPRRVLEGVREGVEHGGNKSGIPTINGSIVFHEQYLGKPLVYCGTVGLMPAEVTGRPGHEKAVDPGDVIVMAGGRIGKDGIHGATFSSEELHQDSPATAVQIGDPITQRKMYDFLMRARDLGLYNAITDNGAGGLSSSVGEMAQFSGGCDMDISKAPLKYDGLRPWEILLSEAQERMTMAVPPDKLDTFLSLASEMDVMAVTLGEFTDSGLFHVRYKDKHVALLDMDFLHNGVPRMELSAVWERKTAPGTPAPLETPDQGGLLKQMLGSLNICSKEYVVRQYDHEVRGGSAVKPLVGALRDGPSDAGVLRPLLDQDLGLVVSHGICPKYSALDTYWMTASCLDEAVRNAVAVGANPAHMAGVDNFCWCDPVQSEKTPDGQYKLAQLVRANQALAHFCLAYGVPCISGKDSMKNDYTDGKTKISIPPTVLFTVISVIPDVNRCVTSDFKAPGDLIYVLGMTWPELGGSELSSLLDVPFFEVPQVDAVAARTRYHTLYQAIQKGLVSACHDLSDGGFGVAVAEMAIGGRLGARIDLSAVPACPGDMGVTEMLYSESNSRFLVCVPPANKSAFEALFAGQHAALVGEVADTGRLTVVSGTESVFNEPVQNLVQAWQETLRW